MIQTCEPSRAAPSKETADERACPSRSHRQYQHCRNHSAHYSRPNHTPLCVVRVMKSSHANAPTHTRERTNERESISAFRFSQFSQRLALLVFAALLLLLRRRRRSSSRFQQPPSTPLCFDDGRPITTRDRIRLWWFFSSCCGVVIRMCRTTTSMAVDHQRPPPAPQPTTSTLAVAPAAMGFREHCAILSTKKCCWSTSALCRRR